MFLNHHVEHWDTELFSFFCEVQNHENSLIGRGISFAAPWPWNCLVHSMIFYGECVANDSAPHPVNEERSALLWNEQIAMEWFIMGFKSVLHTIIFADLSPAMPNTNYLIVATIKHSIPGTSNRDNSQRNICHEERIYSHFRLWMKHLMEQSKLNSSTFVPGNRTSRQTCEIIIVEVAVPLCWNFHIGPTTFEFPAL